MIIATFPTYTQVLPGFEQAISGMRNNLLPLMSVLMIASLVGVAKEGYRAILSHLILLTILVGLAANWQPWFQQASTAVSATFTGDQYDVAKQTERYLVRLQVKAEQKDSDEGYVEAFFRAIMAGALLLLGYITKGIVLLFLVLQKILLTFAYALSPIFVGFFALRSTRGIAVNYLMTTVGLISWPLGFALSACGTYGLVQFFSNLGYFSVAGNVLMLNEAFFALLIIAVWLLVSTIISPVIISKVMATGAQAGSALLSGVANTVAAATGAAVTTGATLAGGAALAGAGGAAAAGGSAPAASGAGTVSGSAGSGSAGISAALRTATGAMLGGGASLVDAAMSGGNGHGAMSGAVASVVRGGGSGRSSGASSGKGGSPSQTPQKGKTPQSNSANQPSTSPTPSPGGGGSATPPPLPSSTGGTSTSAPTPPPAAPPASPTSTAAPSGANPSAGGTPVVMPPQTPNHPSVTTGASTAGAPSAPTASTASPSNGGSTTAGGARGGGPSATGRKNVPATGATVNTSLDGEVARIIDFDTGKPIAGNSLPKPGN